MSVIGFGIVFVAVGLLLIGLAAPLMQRRVAPNSWYGLRVEATFADKDVWYEANARSGRDLCAVGALQILIALVLPVFPIADLTYAAINLATLLVGTVAMAIVGWKRANRLLKERNERLSHA